MHCGIVPFQRLPPLHSLVMRGVLVPGLAGGQELVPPSVSLLLDLLRSKIDLGRRLVQFFRILLESLFMLLDQLQLLLHLLLAPPDVLLYPALVLLVERDAFAKRHRLVLFHLEVRDIFVYLARDGGEFLRVPLAAHRVREVRGRLLRNPFRLLLGEDHAPELVADPHRAHYVQIPSASHCRHAELDAHLRVYVRHDDFIF